MGNVGAREHFEYRAVGDIVNTANRIQSLIKQLGTQLLAAEGVVEALPDVVTRPLGRYLLAGKQQSVAVHEIVGRAGEVDAAQLALLARFAAALLLFTAGRRAAAPAAFSAFPREAPGDGPCRFFMEQCARFAAAAPASWEGVLVLDEK